jgi:hypothetical protein
MDYRARLINKLSRQIAPHFSRLRTNSSTTIMIRILIIMKSSRKGRMKERITPAILATNNTNQSDNRDSLTCQRRFTLCSRMKVWLRARLKRQRLFFNRLRKRASLILKRMKIGS